MWCEHLAAGLEQLPQPLVAQQKQEPLPLVLVVLSRPADINQPLRNVKALSRFGFEDWPVTHGTLRELLDGEPFR